MLVRAGGESSVQAVHHPLCQSGCCHQIWNVARSTDLHLCRGFALCTYRIIRIASRRWLIWTIIAARNTSSFHPSASFGVMIQSAPLWRTTTHLLSTSRSIARQLSLFFANSAAFLLLSYYKAWKAIGWSEWTPSPSIVSSLMWVAKRRIGSSSCFDRLLQYSFQYDWITA